MRETVRASGVPTADHVPNRKMLSIQAARGFAAVLVVSYHTVRSLSLPQYLGYQPFGDILVFGHAGVDFFFVLSGFIITYAHSSDIGRPERLHCYAWRRVTRIYPIYWFVSLIEIIHSVFSPDVAARLQPFHLATSLLLLPDDRWPLVSVAWTLRYEVLFYAMFAATIANRRLCGPFVIIAILSVAASTLVAPDRPWINLALSPFYLEFLIGIAVACFLANHRIARPGLALAGGIACFLLSGMLEAADFLPLNGLWGRSLYGTASGAILLGLVEAERVGLLRFGSMAILFGETSYCLYLVHLSVIPVAIRVLADLGVLRTIPDGTLVIGLIVFSVLVAIILHQWIEAPVMALIRKHTPIVMK